MKGNLNVPFKTSYNNYVRALILLLIFVIFSFWGDWFHYNLGFVMRKARRGYGYEDVYNFIIENLSSHYLIFRFIVWGGALFLLFKITQRLQLNKQLVVLFLGCGWITLFAYARVTLAMCIMFYGYSFLIKPSHSHTKLSYFHGIILIFLSFFFHKSALFGIGMIVLSYLLYIIPSKLFLALFFMIPLAIGYYKNYITEFMLLDSASYGDSMEVGILSGQRYLNTEEEKLGIGSAIRFVLERIAFYSIGIVSIITLIKQSNPAMPSHIVHLSKLYCTIMVCASVFYLDLGFNTSTVYVRFLRFLLIPAILLMSYFYEFGIYRRLVKISFYSAMLMSVYAIMYTMYLVYAGVNLVER